MQSILNDAQLAAMDLRGVRSILDVGCGLAQFTRAMARTADPGVRVVGVERDSRQIEEAERQARERGESELVEFRIGDATRLPLADDERGSFDLVHARFLLEHVPDPPAVIRAMLTAVRPGGRIFLIDDDHELLTLSPACPPAADAWRRYWESFRDVGCDPLVGRRLAGLLREAGCDGEIRVGTVFYGATRGQPLFEPVVDNLIRVMQSASERLDRTGRLSHEELAAAVAALETWRADRGATVWYSLPRAEATLER